MDAEDAREILDNYGFKNLDEMDDEDVLEVAEDLHEDLMEEMQKGGGEGTEMADDEEEDEEEEEEDDEDTEMADDDMEALREQVTNLQQRLEDVEDTVSQAMTSDEAQSQLASADTVEELEAKKEELDRRLSELEDEPADPKTLADADDTTAADYADADDSVSYDPATGSLHR
jgi:uncharacterized protein (DUF3084 family)